MALTVPTWLPVVLMTIGIIAVMRTAFIVAANGSGSFRGDLLISIVGGFGLLYIGQYLLDL